MFIHKFIVDEKKRIHKLLSSYHNFCFHSNYYSNSAKSQMSNYHDEQTIKKHFHTFTTLELFKPFVTKKDGKR